MEQLDCHWTDFHENLIFEYFSKVRRKIQISLKSDKDNIFSENL